MDEFPAYVEADASPKGEATSPEYPCAGAGGTADSGGGDHDGDSTMMCRLRLELRTLKVDKVVEKGPLGTATKAAMAVLCKEVGMEDAELKIAGCCTSLVRSKCI